MNKQWEKDIRDRLATHEAPVPELSWTEIDAALAQRRKASHSPIIYMWPRRIAAAAAVLALIVGGVRMLSPQDNDKSNHPLYTNTKTTATHAPQPAQGITTPCPTPKAQGRPSATLLAMATAAAGEEPTTSHTDGAPRTEEKALEEKHDYTKASEDVHPTPKRKSLDQPTTLSLPSRRSAHALTAQAWFGGGTPSTNGSEGSLVMVGADAPFANYEGNSMKSETEFLTTPSTPRLSKANHHMPLRLGLGLRYALGKRWSVATGLTYSYLSSELKYEDGGESTQKLHYIGIPLQASYAIHRAKHTHVYLSVGGEAQKMVYGRRTTSVPTYGDEEAQSGRVHSDALQLSATAAVGIEYAFAKSLALYAEPGMAYHFDNGSSLPTIYKDRPLNFNINLGLRFNIK